MEHFQLELTKTMIMADAGAAPVMQELRNIGISLAIDDFGTGYSSLMHLKRFPIDSIQFDRYFAKRYDRDRG